MADWSREDPREVMFRRGREYAVIVIYDGHRTVELADVYTGENSWGVYATTHEWDAADTWDGWRWILSDD